MTSPAPAVRRKRPAKPQFTQTILVLEALCVLFATLVAHGLRAAEPAWVWGVGGGLALVMMIAAGMVGRPGGYLVGWVLQGWMVGAAVVLPRVARDVAVLVALVFVGLWVVALRLGGRIDRERAEFDAAHPGVVGP
ncbi:DUF4233 domain-containing protein [Cellulomonas gilvus]|uniref:Integral membrane protein n=1 Tax=Cellulomonas gilvus (strain ATCC 13127 / NRRL B-14078) TaxID=593907 RepID=F8A058_CELGA|nr:DUF4233 domain-containing protein [Cellulomonas gilvus]AEI12622.1 hypothetical protein Celgi_2122 [Cellulomonas gilvus ATCC 13127]